MSTINKDKLGYLGVDFQYRLIQQLLVDRKFGESIIDILQPNYFEDSFLRTASLKIADNYEEYGVIPDVNSLESMILSTASNEIDKEMYAEQFNKIKNAELNNGLHTQDRAMKFCKQQELKKSVREIQKIIEVGDLDSFPECEDILKKALEVGNSKDDGMDVFEDLEVVLAPDFRSPIPTGINGLDDYMDGGLSKGELAVILAPFGVGKTTLMTKIANNAKNVGKNVLQIFFEDNPKVIQRKHLTCWMSGKYTLNQLSDNFDEIVAEAKIRQEQPGEIRLKKFPSDGTTIPMIKQYVKKLISTGFRPDMIILDYIDVVQPSKSFADEWSGEGNVMRQFETLLSEIDIAGWTAVQGNRCVSLDTKVEIKRLGKCEIKDVVVGDEISTHDGYKPISHVFPIEKQPVYKITLKSGKTITVSKKHRFPTENGNCISIEEGLNVGVKLLTKK